MIQVLLGHDKLDTTALYTRVATKMMPAVESPLDLDLTLKPKERQTAAADSAAAVSRPALEVADIFRDHGPAWRRANAGHVSLDQLKVMSAIERCRTAALGGHVARCEKTAPTPSSPTTPAATGIAPSARARRRSEWLAEREAELLPVPYFHVVFTLPAADRATSPTRTRR